MITPLDILSLETWILLGTLFVLARLYMNKKWGYLKKLNIPHDPPSLLQFGNLRSMMTNPESLFTIDAEQKKKYGLISGSYSMFQPRISIADPDIIKQIYIKEASIFRDRTKSLTKVNGKEMNTALTAASGDQWKRIRTTLTPTFSTSKLKDMFGIFEQCTDTTIRVLNKKIKEENGRFDVKDLFGKLSMDVICSSAFGVNAESQEKETELVKKSKEVFSRNFFGIFLLIFMIFPGSEKLAEKLNYSFFDQSLLNYYKRLIDSVITRKKEAKEKARSDILQGMLTAEVSEEEIRNGVNKGITRTELIGNAMVMLIAGYETTANTMVFLTYCIAENSEVRQKLYKEIVETKEKYGKFTYEAINSMKYLDMCFKESLRLYGAVPRNSRYAEAELTVKGFTIPAGVHVDVPVYALHHDEDYWEDPWKFIPERFEDMSKIDPMVYQPFGAGPRNCIGMRFAILEVKMAICKILDNFNLEMCDDTPKAPLKVTLRASMQPKDDVFLRVSPRKDSTLQAS